MRAHNIIAFLVLIILFAACSDENVGPLDGPVGRSDYFIQNESSVDLIYKDNIVYGGPHQDLVIPAGQKIKIGEAADFGSPPPLPSSGLIPLVLYINDNGQERIIFQQDPIDDMTWSIEIVQPRTESDYGWTDFTLVLSDDDLDD